MWFESKLAALVGAAVVLIFLALRADVLAGSAAQSGHLSPASDLAPPTKEQLALIRVCVKYLWRCEGYAKPVAKRPADPNARCTRYCAEEHIYN